MFFIVCAGYDKYKLAGIIQPASRMVTRKERTKQFQQSVQHNWHWHWYNFITSPELDIRIDYSFLSFNPNMILEIVDTYPDKPWSWEFLSELPHITLDDVLSRIEKEWDWFTLSAQLKLTIDDVKTHSNLPWDWDGLTTNKSFSITDIVENLDMAWEFKYLSQFSKLTDIINYPDLPWDFYYISMNNNITIEFVKANLEKGWGWTFVSKNPGIKLDDIINNPDLPWSWESITANPNITLDFVFENIKLGNIICNKFVRRAVSINRGIKINEILANKENPYVKWCWLSVSRRHGLTPEIILANPELSWDIQKLTISFDFIKTNRDFIANRCDLQRVCLNHFAKEELDYKISRAREYLAAYRIQQHWYRIRADPRHPVGRRRLELEYARDFEEKN